MALIYDEEQPKARLVYDDEKSLAMGETIPVGVESGYAKKAFKKLLPTKDQIPELIGTTAAGIAMAGKTSPIGIAATGAGAMAGEIAKQTGQAITGNNPPTSIKESLQRQGAAFARGATAGALDRTVGFARSFFGDKLPTVTFNKFLETSKSQAASELAKGAESLGASLSKTPGMFGSREAVLNKAKIGIPMMEDKIQKAINNTAIKNPNIKIDSFEIAGTLDDLIENYKNVGDNAAARKLMNLQMDFLNKHGESISLQQANALKRSFYSVINDRAYLKAVDANPSKVQGQRLIASALRKAISEKVPELAELNAKQGLLIGTRDSLIQAIAGDNRSMLKAMAGSPIEAGLTFTARTLRKAGNVANKLPLQTATRAGVNVGLQNLSPSIENAMQGIFRRE